jgi:hypothetical protein
MTKILSPSFAIENPAKGLAEKEQFLTNFHQIEREVEDYYFDLHIEFRDKLADKLGLDYLGAISEGRAWGKKTSESGRILVDTQNEKIIEIPDKGDRKIQFASKFIRGRALVLSDPRDEYYFIDQDGKSVSKYYDKSSYHICQNAGVSEYKGDPIWVDRYGLISGNESVQQFYLTPDGKEICTDVLPFQRFRDFSEGYLWVAQHGLEHGTILINRDGEKVKELDPKIYWASPFRNGRCLVYGKDKSKKDYLYSMDLQYRLTKLKVNIDDPLNIMDAGSGFFRGVENGEFVFFKTTGEIVRLPEGARGFKFEDGYIDARTPIGTQVYDKNGKPVYEGNEQLSIHSSDGMVAISSLAGYHYFYNLKDQKYILDEKGQPKPYYSADEFYAGRSWVVDSSPAEDSCLIDRDGKEKVRVWAGAVVDYEDGVYSVRTHVSDNFPLYYDRHGNRVFAKSQQQGQKK